MSHGKIRRGRADDAARKVLKVGDDVEVFSEMLGRKWIRGTIRLIFQDYEGEWLRVQYGSGPEYLHRINNFRRFGDYLRPPKGTPHGDEAPNVSRSVTTTTTTTTTTVTMSRNDQYNKSTTTDPAVISISVCTLCIESRGPIHRMNILVIIRVQREVPIHCNHRRERQRKM